MIKHKLKNNNGFMALMSAIIISAVLLLIVTSLSFTGFYTRSNILDSELKEKSSALAEACVDTALLKLANDPLYAPPSGGEYIKVDEVSNEACTIKSISGSIIKTKANYNNKYFTNLEVRFNGGDLSVISWEETPN